MSEKVNIREPAVISKEFNTIVKNLIALIEKKSRDDLEIANIDRLKKRIVLLKATCGDGALITESADYFIKYANQILERDESFFMNMIVDKQDKFVINLIDSIKYKYKNSSSQEQDSIYKDIVTLFECAIEYKISIAV